MELLKARMDLKAYYTHLRAQENTVRGSLMSKPG